MNEKGKDVILSIGASLVCIIIGLLVGLLILCCINSGNAMDGFQRILKGGFYLKPKGIGSEITQAAPLIMTGLSVAFAFKTGLFNIGAAGQYTVGIFGALYSACWQRCSAVRCGVPCPASSRHISMSMRLSPPLCLTGSDFIWSTSFCTRDLAARCMTRRRPVRISSALRRLRRLYPTAG